MSRHLSTIVRRALLEADAKGLAPEEPSFWREVGKTTDRFGRAAAGAVGTLAKATLDTFVGQAHAPRSEREVQQAQASRVTLVTLLEGLVEYLHTTRFRVGAKILDAAGRRDMVAGAVGEEEAQALMTGSLLHEMLEAGAFVPVLGYFSAILDGVVYAAEGEVERSAECFVLAGIMGAMEGRALKSAGMGNASAIDVMRRSYSDVPVVMEKVGEIPLSPQDAAQISDFVDRQTDVLAKSGVESAPQIATKARKILAGRKFMFRAPPEVSRFLEANKSGRLLVNGGVDGKSLSVLKEAAAYFDELKRAARSNVDSFGYPIYADVKNPDAIRHFEFTKEFYEDNYPSSLGVKPKEGSIPPDELKKLPPMHDAGASDLMRAWKKTAARYPQFWRKVKTVHWTGFRVQNLSDAVKPTINFITRPATSADLSTVGYTGDMRVGEAKMLPVGVLVEGEITLATAGDAGTTNPHFGLSAPRPDVIYDKKPQVGFNRLPTGDAPLGKDVEHLSARVTVPRIARGAASGSLQSLEVSSKLMVGPASWQEPYTVGLNHHNEVVVRNWRPKAIVMDISNIKMPMNSRPFINDVEGVVAIFEQAEKLSLPVVDASGRKLSLRDMLERMQKRSREVMQRDLADSNDTSYQPTQRKASLERLADQTDVSNVIQKFIDTLEK